MMENLKFKLRHILFATAAITTTNSCHTTRLTHLCGEGFFFPAVRSLKLLYWLCRLVPTPVIYYIIFLVCHLYSIY